MSDIKKTARAVVIIDKKIILIHRKKYNNKKIIKDYYVIPGGHLDEEETFEQAAIREVKEELGIEVSIEKEILHEFNNDLNQDEIFYECKYKSGILGTGFGEEWSNTDIQKYGSYEIVKFTIDEVKKINLLPKSIKEILINKYKI